VKTLTRHASRFGELVDQRIPFALFFEGVKEGRLTSDVNHGIERGGAGHSQDVRLNVVSFFAYLGVPVATVSLVNASGKPFRNP
jgi:hypothetical protein